MAEDLLTEKQKPTFMQTGVGVWIVSIITNQLFLLMWLYGVKRDLVKLGYKDTPATWTLIIPGIHFYGVWKLSKSLEEFTKGQFKQISTFLIVGCLFGIGAGIMQDRLNAQIS